MNSNIEYKNIRRGFTIIEALVAISILLLAITGAFAVAQSSLQSSNLAKNRTTAYYLAQEAIEFVRHARDNNGLAVLQDRESELNWLDGVAFGDNPPCEIDNGLCLVDVTSPDDPLTPCGEGCPNLFIDTETGLFQYAKTNEGEAVNSGFNRRVQVFSVPSNPNEVIVKVTVTWPQGFLEKTLEVSENLYNWQQLQPL